MRQKQPSNTVWTHFVANHGVHIWDAHTFPLFLLVPNAEMKVALFMFEPPTHFCPASRKQHNVAQTDRHHPATHALAGIPRSQAHHDRQTKQIIISHIYERN